VTPLEIMLGKIRPYVLVGLMLVAMLIAVTRFRRTLD